jgi:hypothetical protein
MRYITIGLLFGGVWGVIQLARGDITDPVALAIPIIFCGIFGGVLWGAKILVARMRK